MIPFPPFEPDRAVYASGQEIINCVPVADGWGPLADLTVISEALASTCLGAWYVRTSSGAYRVFAATQTAIYEQDTTDYSWTDVSRLAGGAYAVPDGDEWSAAVFGTVLILTNIADVVQSINVDSGSNFAALAGSPPQAKYVWVAGDYLVLGNHAGFPNRIETSGINDATYWTIGLKGCDVQDFPDGDEVMGGIGTEKGAVIFQRTMIRAMTLMYSGEYSFRTDVVNATRGIASPLSISNIAPGRYVYYSPDGFFMGPEGTAIGRNRVDRWFNSEADGDLIHTVKAMADPFQKIVWFQATRPDTTKFLLGYSWAEDRWCYADSNFTAMAALVTPAVTIDGLALLYATIDDVLPPFDSRLFTGGAPTMAVFDTSNRMCLMTGLPREATLTTVDTQLSPGRRSFVTEATAISDCSDYTLTPITATKYGGARTAGTASSPHSSSGICPMRSSGRLHAFRMGIAAGVDWQHVTGVDVISMKPEGRV